MTTPGRFLLAESPPRDARAGIAIRMTLERGTFACREGLVCLLDSPARPVAPRLQALARECRFLVPEGRPLLEQSGVGDPGGYRTAVEWIDAGSRYEGSSVFWRIDSAAERIDLDYASQPQRLDHDPRIEEWPDADRRP